MRMQAIPTNECRKAVLPILLAKGVSQNRAEEIELCVGEVIGNCHRHGGDEEVSLGVEVDDYGIFVQVYAKSHEVHFREIEKAIKQRINKGAELKLPEWGTSLMQGLAIACKCSERIDLDEYGGLIMAFALN